MKVSLDVFSRTVGEEEVLLDMKSGDYFGLNPSATLIWQGLKSGRTPTEIVEDLVAQFEITHLQARQDIQELVTQLNAAGLLSNEEN